MGTNLTPGQHLALDAERAYRASLFLGTPQADREAYRIARGLMAQLLEEHGADEADRLRAWAVEYVNAEDTEGVPV
jgi:hypothetical protein